MDGSIRKLCGEIRLIFLKINKVKKIMRKLTLSKRDLKESSIWLRWQYTTDEIDVETNIGIKKATWKGDKYLLKF